jgi:hypothetical protein
MLTLVGGGQQRGQATTRWLGWPLVMTCATSDGAPALVPSAMAIEKPQVPSVWVGSLQRRLQQWGVSTALGSSGGGGKVVEGYYTCPYIELSVLVRMENHPESIPWRNRRLLQNLLWI